jgi:hypothetical protein
MPKGGLPKHHPDHDPLVAFQTLPIEQPEAMDRILAMLPECRDREAAKRDLIETSYLLSHFLHETAGRVRKLLRAELKSFDRRLAKRQPATTDEADAMLLAISAEARKCVEMVARRHLRGRMKMPVADLLACAVEPSRDNPARKAKGLTPRTKLHAWVRIAALAQLPDKTWQPIKPHSKLTEATDAPSSVQDGQELVPVKRPADNALRIAVGSLAAIWLEQSGKTATMSATKHDGHKYGPFLDFCCAVIEPVYEARERKTPGVHSAVQEQIRLLHAEPGDFGMR